MKFIVITLLFFFLFSGAVNAQVLGNFSGKEITSNEAKEFSSVENNIKFREEFLTSLGLFESDTLKYVVMISGPGAGIHLVPIYKKKKPTLH